MKTLSSISTTELNAINNSNKEYKCDYVFGPFGYVKLKETIISNNHKCEFCDKKENMCPIMDPAISHERAWLCLNPLCVVNTAKIMSRATIIQATSRRALEWPLFCELNTIGDIHHNVRFESIEQSKGKMDYLNKFLAKPSGIILMEGNTGTGKTYAAMGICEKFIRSNTSCLFMTQKKLFNSWLETFKPGCFSNIVNQVLTVNLLVIDDFGTKENSASFMDFFMELINTRMQWTDRATVITTNLNSEKLAIFCGEALSDRLRTAQRFTFKEESRREKPIL